MKSIVNLYWSDGKNKHCTSAYLPNVPTELETQEEVQKMIEGKGRISVERCELLIIARIIPVQLNIISGPLIGGKV